MNVGKGAVLITGCSSGIGRAMAENFHRRGFLVFATARRLDSLAPLAEAGIRVLALDVTRASDIARVAEQVLEQSDGVDILINNAGYGAMAPLVEIPADELRRQFETNVFGPVALAQALAPAMIRRGGGRIVNIGSVSGILTTPFAGAYCATKAALHSLSDALRMELAPFGIHVITVQPGAIRSRFGENATAAVERALAPQSLYRSVESAIRARANASQLRATPAEQFAQRVIEKALRKHPPRLIRAGVGSHSAPIMERLLPSRLLDWALMKRFQLDRLRQDQL